MSSCSPVSARDQRLHDDIYTIRPIAAAISLRRPPKEAVSERGSRAVRCAWKVQRVENYMFVVVIVVVANLNCKMLNLMMQASGPEVRKDQSRGMRKAIATRRTLSSLFSICNLPGSRQWQGRAKSQITRMGI